jgi:hypothetical protein
VLGSSVTTTTNTFTYDLLDKKALTDINTTYGANFYIEYVPFNKTEASAWSGVIAQSRFSDPPKWVIRNGLVDAEQTNRTNFSRFGNPSASGYNYKDYNANGGIAFKVKATKGYHDNVNSEVPTGSTDSDNDGYPEAPGTVNPNDYLLYNGKFQGNKTVQFSTAGYDGAVQVSYFVAPHGDYSKTNRPPHNLFTSAFAGTYAAGEDHTGTVVSNLTGNVDIWLVFIKDGKVSNRIAINTGTGGLNIGWQWGTDTAQTLLGDILSQLNVPQHGYTLQASDINASTALNFTYFTATNWPPEDPSLWSQEVHVFDGGSTFADLFAGESINHLSTRYSLTFIVTLKSGTLPAGFNFALAHPLYPNTWIEIDATQDNLSANVDFSFGGTTEMMSEILDPLWQFVITDPGHILTSGVDYDPRTDLYARFNTGYRSYTQVGNNTALQLGAQLNSGNTYRVLFNLYPKEGGLGPNFPSSNYGGTYAHIISDNARVYLECISEISLHVTVEFDM